MSKLLRSDFPATYIPTAFDLRDELVKLNKLVRRSSAAVSKQIEVYIDTLYDKVKTGSKLGTPPDGTTAATVTLKQLYSDFTDFTRAERIKIDRLLALSDNAAVKAAVAAQLAYWLEVQGWLVELLGAVLTVTISDSGTYSDVDGEHEFTQASDGAVLTTTITDAGTFTDSDGVHAFSQASSSGAGEGLTGEVTIASGVISAVTYITRGEGYTATDTIVIDVPTATETGACTLTAATVLSVTTSGTGLSGTATISGDEVTAVDFANKGGGYAGTDVVAFEIPTANSSLFYLTIDTVTA